jgi:hypothetical protein
MTYSVMKSTNFIWSLATKTLATTLQIRLSLKAAAKVKAHPKPPSPALIMSMP